MSNYKYTLDKIIGHLIALEEHFETNACWTECIPKHLSVLKVYLQEMIAETLNSPYSEYWHNTYKDFDKWANTILPVQELAYIDYVRKLRKNIIDKFWVYEVKMKKGSLNEGEAHPATFSAKDYLKSLGVEKLMTYLDVYSSCAIEGNRLGDICGETLDRLLHGKQIRSDRYILGLAFSIKQMEEKK